MPTSTATQPMTSQNQPLRSTTQPTNNPNNPDLPQRRPETTNHDGRRQVRLHEARCQKDPHPRAREVDLSAAAHLVGPAGHGEVKNV